MSSILPCYIQICVAESELFYGLHFLALLDSPTQHWRDSMRLFINANVFRHPYCVRYQQTITNEAHILVVQTESIVKDRYSMNCSISVPLNTT